MPVPVVGQVAVSGTATPLSAAFINGQAFTIKAPASNAKPIFLGPAGVTTTTGYQLDPGDSIDYGRADQHGSPRFQLNVSDFFAAGTAGDVCVWLVSP